MGITEQLQSIGMIPRDVQVEYSAAVAEALSLRGIALLNAETGCGKGLGYLCPLLDIFMSGRDKHPPRFIIATQTHALLKQLTEKEFPVLQRIAAALGHTAPSGALLIGRANYVSPDRLAAAVRGQPLSPESEALLVALQNHSGTIAEFRESYGELPLGLHPNQICMTATCKSSNYDESREAALRADVIFTTHAMLAVDMMSTGQIFCADERPRYLVVDEADQLVSVLESCQQRRANLVQLRHNLLPHLGTKDVGALDDIIQQIRVEMDGRDFVWDTQANALAKDAITQISALMSRLDDEAIGQEIYNEYPALKGGNLGQYGLGVSSVRQEPAIISFAPFFASSFAGYIERNYRSCVLTSGTLSIKDDTQKGMSWIRIKLNIKEPTLQGLYSPARYGDMTLTLAGPASPSVFRRNDDSDEAVLRPEWLDLAASTCHLNSQKGKTVILAGSHDEASRIATRLKKLGAQAIVHHRSGQKLAESVLEFKAAGENACLITPAGHVGLDIRKPDGSLGFSQLVITRIPFASLDMDSLRAIEDYYLAAGRTDITMAVLLQRHFMSSMTDAIRTLRQGIGRGIRSENDHINVTICDPRFPLYDDRSSRYNALRFAIPPRFLGRYVSASRLDVATTEQVTTEELFF